MTHKNKTKKINHENDDDDDVPFPLEDDDFFLLVVLGMIQYLVYLNLDLNLLEIQ